MLTMNEYQQKAGETAKYPGRGDGGDQGLIYTLLGIAEEAGETAGVMSKTIRDDWDDDRVMESLMKELGDLLWFISQAAHELKTDLETIAIMNLQKLADRRERGVISGQGDER